MRLSAGTPWNYRRRMRLHRLMPWFDLLAGARSQGAVAVRLSACRIARQCAPFPRPLAGGRRGPRPVRAGWTAHELCRAAYGFLGDGRLRKELSGSMLSDLSDFLTPLLRRLDRNSMGASVEARVPFLDHRLVHTAINLPLKWRIRRNTDKWILKQIGTVLRATDSCLLQAAGLEKDRRDARRAGHEHADRTRADGRAADGLRHCHPDHHHRRRLQMPGQGRRNRGPGLRRLQAHARRRRGPVAQRRHHLLRRQGRHQLG